MDTDDLTVESYNAVINEAEIFDHNLTIQFGLLSYQCDSEEEYLKAAIELIDEIRIFSEEELSDLFFSEPFNKVGLYKCLDKIIDNIHEVNKIPEEKRIRQF